jgi:hypothetical protein
LAFPQKGASLSGLFHQLSPPIYLESQLATSYFFTVKPCAFYKFQDPSLNGPLPSAYR